MWESVVIQKEAISCLSTLIPGEICRALSPWFLFVCSTAALIYTTFWHKGHRCGANQNNFRRIENKNENENHLVLVNRGSPMNDEEEFEGSGAGRKCTAPKTTTTTKRRTPSRLV